jgi:hypothetical protein
MGSHAAPLGAAIMALTTGVIMGGASCANIIGAEGDYYEVTATTSSGAAGGGATGGTGGTTSSSGQGGSAGAGGSSGGGGGTATPTSCQDLHQSDPGLGSGAYTIDPDGDGATAAFEVHCDMVSDEGGWTLVYNRVNAYFTPDHMVHQLPASVGPKLTDNSTHWFILPGAARWRWQVSVDGGATFRQLITSIPGQAANTTHETVTDVLIAQIYDNTTETDEPFYYQTFVQADECLYGCGSSSGTWFGIVDVHQGAGDQNNAGIGGHSDQCNLDDTVQPADNYTWGSDNLEVYWSDHKNIQGNGVGGTLCTPTGPTDLYRMRIWLR